MIEIYDGDMRFLGPADNVIRVGYTLKHNELGTAEAVLPMLDEMAGRIQVGRSFAKIYDGEDFVGTFRFSGATVGHERLGQAQYRLDSAECTLLDDMLEGWHEIGGDGYSTRQVMTYILAQQTTQRWTLGRCDFNDFYQYNFSDVTLLEALMSLGECLTDDYAFQFDTSATPWTVNLVRLSETPAASLVYSRNMTRMSRRIDGKVVTRLYGRGYGDGDNQLTIESVNNGLPYLDADQTAMDAYGVRMGVHVDTRQTDPETLRAHMQQILAKGCRPGVTYDVMATDLYMLTGQPDDRPGVGDLVRVVDETLEEPVLCRVSEIGKDDLDGDPGRLSIVLDNGGGGDIAAELNDVLERIGVQQLYSQGATSMYAVRGAENADSSHPMTLDFYIPGNVTRINKCLLRWKKEPYRVDFKMTSAGGYSSQTSEAGGGTSVTYPEQVITKTYVTTGVTDNEGQAVTLPQTGVADGSGNHVHTMQHYHGVRVAVDIPSQQITLDDHTHKVEIPEHSHNLEYGITSGGSTAARVTILVDGNEVSEADSEIDVAPYLSTGSDGRIRRGAWHTIKFQPNGNARIVANLFVQQFLQSRGKGDY